MNGPPFEALVLCTTPRSGSTLLCALLESSGVAGRPESWFRAEDRSAYAEAWRIGRGAVEWSAADYVRAAQVAGRSANGVFSLRLMLDTLAELLAELRALHPGAEGAALLERAFGRCRFVHLRRQDPVAQAVSRVRAEQTGLWHRAGAWEERDPSRSGPARYDAGAIARFRDEAQAGNAAWEAWFEANGLRPATVLYEDLALDPAGVARALIAGLGLPDPERLLFANERLADGESAAWAARFRREERDSRVATARGDGSGGVATLAPAGSAA